MDRQRKPTFVGGHAKRSAIKNSSIFAGGGAKRPIIKKIKFSVASYFRWRQVTAPSAK